MTYHLPRTFNEARLSNQAVVPGPIVVQGFTVYSSLGAAQFVMWFDEVGVPGAGAVPAMVLPIGAHNVCAAFFGDKGRNCERGFTVCNSTTETVLTIGAANCFFDVNYSDLEGY